MRDDAGTVDLRPSGPAASTEPRLAGAPVGIARAGSEHLRPAGAVSPPTPQRGHRRVLNGLRHPANWLQLLRFAIVGASGYALNFAIYAVAVHSLGIEYHLAAAAAWIIAGVNNFIWNRHWTFKAGDGEVRVQALRFLLVSLVALGFLEGALTVFVEAMGLDKLLAQVLALGVQTPVNFLGNKLWSFRLDLYSDAPPAQEA